MGPWVPKNEKRSTRVPCASVYYNEIDEEGKATTKIMSRAHANEIYGGITKTLSLPLPAHHIHIDTDLNLDLTGDASISNNIQFRSFQN